MLCYVMEMESGAIVITCQKKKKRLPVQVKGKENPTDGEQGGLGRDQDWQAPGWHLIKLASFAC